ncbi:MAG: hypothetical protein IJ181_13820 [Acidaminococcaceae bacterium]|nr:hypothetical protein [Acidaminococcaceae bacterium]
MTAGSELYDLLPTGRGNAISMQKLADLTGSRPRQVRQAIFNLRTDGLIIAGDSNGYYIPADDQELISYYKTAKARGLATLASIQSARKALQQAGIDTEGGGSR